MEFDSANWEKGMAIFGEVANKLHETRSQNWPTSQFFRGDLPTGVYTSWDDMHLIEFSTSKDGKVASAINFGDPNVIWMKSSNGGGIMKLILILKMFTSPTYPIKYGFPLQV